MYSVVESVVRNAVRFGRGNTVTIRAASIAKMDTALGREVVAPIATTRIQAWISAVLE